MTKNLLFIAALSAILTTTTSLISHVQAAPNPLSKHKSKEPVEVTSDTLEVFQLENRAVFTGHVVAIQGDVRLKADQMTIFYNPPKDDEEKKKTAKNSSQEEENPGSSQGPATDAVKKIDAKGNVFLSTPEETASGDKGIYDVENNMIYLHENVVLTQGNNVLRGSHLTYNFTTGKSTMSSNEGQKAAGSNEPVPGKGKKRVRALFVPEGNQGVTNTKK